MGPEGSGLPLVEKVVDEAIAATCAEACGVLRKLHEGTLEYTKQRKQFGQPIAGFQVLQHRMVDMFIQVEQAVSMTYMATIKLGDDAERAKAASAAKVQIGKACKFVGQNAIQLHGGMGMTDEMAIGHYFKRATMIESAFGSTDHHLARYEGLTRLRPPRLEKATRGENMSDLRQSVLGAWELVELKRFRDDTFYRYPMGEGATGRLYLRRRRADVCLPNESRMGGDRQTGLGNISILFWRLGF